MKLALGCSEMTIQMACDRLGGTVEGHKTHSGDFLQRIDQLVRIEKLAKLLDEETDGVNLPKAVAEILNGLRRQIEPL